MFDGIRDKKLKANWDQTPQPIVCKLMTSRCMRDKIPKGDFIVRASLMDRLVDNKLYYKFVEYGQRIKQQKLVDKEKRLRAKKGQSIDNFNAQIDNVADNKEGNPEKGVFGYEEEEDARLMQYKDVNLFDSVVNVDEE